MNFTNRKIELKWLKTKDVKYQKNTLWKRWLERSVFCFEWLRDANFCDDVQFCWAKNFEANFFFQF